MRGGTFGPTLFFIKFEVWRGLSPCGFPPCLGEQGLGFFPAWENRSRALGLHSEKNACVRGAGKEKTGCAICPAQPRVRARSKCRHKPGARLARRSRAPGKNRVRARQGEEKDRVRDLLGAAARVTRLPAQMTLRRGAFARRVSSRPQGTGGRLFPCPGKQKPGAGAHPEPTACVRDAGKKKTGCATCPAQPRVRARSKCRHKPGARFARRSRAPGTSRVRARRGEEIDRVRDLPAAGAGFLPARENRSPVWASSQKEPRACAAGQKHKPGA